MPVRLKKLLGTVLILIWLFFYVLFALKLAATILPDSHWLVQLAYYAFAGIAWIVPPFTHPLDDETGRNDED